MTSRRLPVLAAAFAVGLLAATGSSEATSRTMVVQLVSVGTSSRTVDSPPTGASAGDRVFETSKLRNRVAQFGKAKGAVVGHDRATLTVVSTTAVKIDGVATLPGGTIVIRGRIHAISAAKAIVPVAGGTGDFAGARGRLLVTQLDQRRAANVYQLTLP